MILYNVSSKQLIANSILISLVTAITVSLYFEYKRYLDLPEVYISNRTGACVKVVNYANGDAYNCNDVNTVLRKYVKVTTQ